MLVKNWMSKPVISVDADSSMQDAVYLLREHNIKFLPVMASGKLAGVVTDRDLKRASPSDATTLDMHELLHLVSKIKVKDLMSRDPFTIPPDFTIEEAAQLLMENRISGLPVMEKNGSVAGVITQSDIFRALIKLTGLGRKGVQFGVRLKDVPGVIKDVKETVHKFGGRTGSILSSAELAPEGYFNAYFRIYNMDRENMTALTDALQDLGTLLYMVDHRDGKRTMFAPE